MVIQEDVAGWRAAAARCRDLCAFQRQLSGGNPSKLAVVGQRDFCVRSVKGDPLGCNKARGNEAGRRATAPYSP
jgi:hypothetical protein